MHRMAIVSFCLLFACTQHGVADNSSVESAPLNDSEQQRIESALRLQAFAIDPFEKLVEDSQASVGARAKLLQRFGTPLKEESSKRPDRTSDEFYSLFTLQFDGVTFRVVEDQSGDHSWIEWTEITGNSHALKYGLHIGSTRSQVISLFQPTEFLKDKNPMRLYTNGVQNPPNMAIWEGPVIVVAISFDSEDRVTGITVNPSAL